MLRVVIGLTAITGRLEAEGRCELWVGIWDVGARCGFSVRFGLPAGGAKLGIGILDKVAVRSFTYR